MGLLTQLAIKAALSGLIVAFASEAARRSPGWGGLIASLPLVSLLTMVWLWRDSRDPAAVSDLSMATAIYVASSLPAFVLLATLLRRGAGFWAALLAGAALAAAGYAAAGWLGRRLGLPV